MGSLGGYLAQRTGIFEKMGCTFDYNQAFRTGQPFRGLMIQGEQILIKLAHDKKFGRPHLAQAIPG